MTSVNEDVEDSEPSRIAGGNTKWCRCFGKQFGSSSECYTELSCDLRAPPLSIHPRRTKTLVHVWPRTQMVMATWFLIAKGWKRPKWPSLMNAWTKCTTPRSGMWLSREKERGADMCCRMDTPRKPHAEWKKPVPEGYRWYDSTKGSAQNGKNPYRQEVD